MFEIFVIFVCLLLNALLSMSEMAFVTVRRSRLDHLARNGSSAATKLLKLRSNPERTLSVIQIGITLVGAIAAAVGGAGAEENLAPFYETRIGLSENLAELCAIVTVVAPITYLSVVIGELVPKSLALKYATPIAIGASRILAFLDTSLSPVVTFLEKSTKLLLKPFQQVGESSDTSSTAEEAIELDSVSPESRQSLLRHSRLEKRTAQDAMRPWSKVVWIDRGMSAESIRKILVEKGYTRLPVFDGESVIGILHTKEFLALDMAGLQNWQSIVRSPLSIQKGTPLPRTLSMLQRQRRHMGVVLDGHHVLGIVTIEDIIEEVFGEIDDERDETNIQKLLARRRDERDSYHLRSCI